MGERQKYIPTEIEINDRTATLTLAQIAPL